MFLVGFKYILLITLMIPKKVYRDIIVTCPRKGVVDVILNWFGDIIFLVIIIKLLFTIHGVESFTKLEVNYRVILIKSYQVTLITSNGKQKKTALGQFHKRAWRDSNSRPSDP